MMREISGQHTLAGRYIEGSAAGAGSSGVYSGPDGWGLGPWGFTGRTLAGGGFLRDVLEASMHGYSGLFRAPERLASLELSDGREVQYREIRPEDQAALQRFHSRMSEASIRKRFFGPMPQLTDKQARYFSHLDERRAALVALDPDEPTEIIGVVRFDREGDDGPAEYAAAIEDRYQGRGLGLLLTRKLMDLARERGVREVYAYVMPDNRPMTVTLKRLELPTRIHWEEGLQRVELTLQEPEQ